MQFFVLVIVSFSYVKSDGDISEYQNLNREGWKEARDTYEYKGQRGSGLKLFEGREIQSEYREQLKGKDYYDKDEKDKLDIVFGYTGPTANDEPENLIRPCALEDYQCIRKYFASNSKCVPAYGPIPDPLTLDINTVSFTAVRLTVAFTNFLVLGLSSAKINDFYYNKQTGNLVFAIDVKNLNFTSPRAYFRYQRTAKEPIVLADYTTVNFRTSTHTAVIPKKPNLRLDLADVHVYVQDGTPSYFFGPGYNNSTDPEVIVSSTQFPVRLPFLVREGLLFDSQLLTAIYIQKNICDFGLKLAVV